MDDERQRDRFITIGWLALFALLITLGIMFFVREHYRQQNMIGAPGIPGRQIPPPQ
jgi:hypothetical protein